MSCRLTNGSDDNYCTVYFTTAKCNKGYKDGPGKKKIFKKKRFCAITLLPPVQCVEVRWSECRTWNTPGSFTSDPAMGMRRCVPFCLCHSSLKCSHVASAFHFSFSLQYVCLCYREMFSSEGVVFKKLC